MNQPVSEGLSGPRWIIGVIVAGLLGTLLGCGGSGASSSLTVFAATSLKGSFTEIAKDFEAAHPGTHVLLSFGASSTLAQQINQGAPADVFAAADDKTMTTVTAAGNAAGRPVEFVRNELEIALAPGNPKGIHHLQDLTKPGVLVVVCAPQVPCGSATAQALAAGHVQLEPASLEQDVTAARIKVELGDADAALVYRTEVKAAGGRVEGVDFPEAAVAVNTYPIVALAQAPNRRGAQEFVSYVRSEKAQAVLSRAGFQPGSS